MKKELRPRQLLRVEDLSAAQIKKIILAAYRQSRLKKIIPRRGKPVPLGLVFAETSTRTRVSFERAARSLGLEPYLLESSSSSIAKGEDLTDTLLTLGAMGIQNFVVRTGSTEELLALRELPYAVLNAGDGVGEHPSQALLDLLCLLGRVGGSWSALLKTRIVIVGNLSHSRVVHSWISLAKLLGLHLTLVSPPQWRATGGTTWTADLASGLAGADVVMALRVQKERLGDTAGAVGFAEYVRQYQITEDLLAGRPLMHPGPVNWGVELESGLRGYANSFILDQVRCGYYLRATLLNEFVAS